MTSVTEVREFVNQQLESLRQQQEKLIANLNATDGAIQVCKGILGKLDESAAEPQ